MATQVIEPERIRARRSGQPAPGDYVLYWMQQAQRARSNPALEHAVRRANDLGVPLAVVFCVVPDYPEASARHYRFMLEGLADVRATLERRSIAFEAMVGQPKDVVPALSHRARLLVFDRGYLPVAQRWRREVESEVAIPIDEVETDVVVPVDLVSDKQETAARTIRPKIHDHLDRFVVELRTTPLENPAIGTDVTNVDLARTGSEFPALDLDDVGRALDELGPAAEPAPVGGWTGGTNAAVSELRRFVADVLPGYAESRNRFDQAGSTSRLSPYLHFGQISPVDVVRVACESEATGDDLDGFIDEVVVRRELAVNYVLHQPDHDRFAGLPEWARSTLTDHEGDERPSIFTADELEAGETDDEIWNTIMGRIRADGWVHNQLRMYWGKQILSWTRTPEYAYRTLLDLNNRYFLDGRDPNSYANVGWCFGLHDQGFQERSVIGKIRPFTDQALRRKGDLDGWLEANRHD